MLDIQDRLQEAGNLLEAQDNRQLLRLPRVGNVFDHPPFAQGDPIQKAQGANRQVQHGPRSVLLINEVHLIPADLLWAEQLRRLAVVFGELGDLLDVVVLRV